MNEYIILRVIIAGDKNTGKSILTSRLNDKEIEKKYIETIGVDFYVKFLNDIGLKVNFWDFSGDKIHEEITFPYFKRGNILLLVYAADNYKSLIRIQTMYKEYKEKKIINDHKIIVVCNKSDLVHNNSELDIGRNWAKSINSDFIFVSAKNNTNIKELFNMILFIGNVKLEKKEKKENKKKTDMCFII